MPLLFVSFNPNRSLDRDGKIFRTFGFFQLLSAFLSASCFHLRFDIANYAFNATVATCSEQTLTRFKIQ